MAAVVGFTSSDAARPLTRSDPYLSRGHVVEEVTRCSAELLVLLRQQLIGLLV